MSAIRRQSAMLALAGVAAAALVACGSFRAAGSGPTRAGTAVAGDATAEQALGNLVRLAGERVKTADTVAAAKWGTPQPVDDPARERAVLDSASAKAARLGIDQATVRRIFEDQITANKAVQRALYAQWRARPAERPTQRPDLAVQVRPVLDRIDSRLLTAIQQAQPLLTRPGCGAALNRYKAATVRAMGLDAVHQGGLDQALARICPA
ncbi:chorismate mutase [Streptomyces sp. NPDC101151]|uniref:chorismate mutase n=1 Tax=Streptomyces sp. NPDC101151 TaxID=3366115 RepID=UPI00382C992E